MSVTVTVTYSHEFPNGMQHHGKTLDVIVESASEVNYDVLHQAETIFLERFRTDLPGHRLVAWVAGAGDGSRYSEYRAFLPAGR